MRPRGITRGNSVAGGTPAHGAQLASMRPRGITRGNAGASGRQCRLLRRFNEAAGYYPRKRRAAAGSGNPCKPASMRPRGITRGNLFRLSWLGFPAFASMRPRGITRGNVRRARQSEIALHASMRPRGITRGNRPRRRGEQQGCRAGFNEAAGYYPRKRAPRGSDG